MATILDSLKAINGYPIPLRTFLEVCESRGLSLEAEADRDVLTSSDYRLAEADLLLWLSLSPNISQGGQNYSFTDEQRLQMRNRAKAVYAELETEEYLNKPIYGYKGSRL